MASVVVLTDAIGLDAILVFALECEVALCETGVDVRMFNFETLSISITFVIECLRIIRLDRTQYGHNKLDDFLGMHVPILTNLRC